MKLLIIIFLVLSIITSLYALDTSSSAFTIELIIFLQGGGSVSSTNTIADFTAVGEGQAYLTQLLSTNFGLYSGQLFLFFPTRKEGLRWLISDLQARTEILGPLIPEATWQKDNDPYFYWNIITQPPERIKGFSISLDLPPDLIIDIDTTSYQFPDDDIISGKHTFFVLPFVTEGVAEQESLLKFNIWVDVDLPVINQIQPQAGTVISDNQIPISCYLADYHSGLDLNLTTLTLNNEMVIFNYDPETQILEFHPIPSWPEGRNTGLVKAYDLVGNYIVKGWDFIVDTQPPTGKILLNAGEEVTHSAYVFINIEVSDLVSGIKNIYISNDGIFDTELGHPYPYEPVIYNWLVSQPDVNGPKTVFVKFEDFAGNLSETYKDQITLRLLTPDTRIISGPTAVTEETSADFVFEASKPGCLFSFRLDNGVWSDWSSSSEAHFSGLSEGNHYFYVKSGFDLNADRQITIDEEDPTPSQWVWTMSRPEGYLERLRQRILFWRR